MKKPRVREVVTVLAYFAGVTILWQVLVTAIEVPTYILPTPAAIALNIVSTSRILAGASYYTTAESLVGFIVGAVIGLGLGIAVVYSKVLDAILSPTIVVIQSIPKIMIFPIFILWFGLTFVSVSVMAFVISFFPIFINTASGLGKVDTDLIELARSMRATKAQIFRKIRIPHALPYIFDALKVSISLAFIGAVIGEFLIPKEGLGALILLGQFSEHAELMFASILALTVLVLIFTGAIGLFQRFFVHWHPEEMR